MAAGKNKNLNKKKKTGKKVVDPFVRKEWYDVRAPTYFKRPVGRTVCTKTIGQKTARDNLLGRVFTQSLGDLNDKGDDFRKFSMKIEEVQGNQCLTSFNGMDMTTDKLRSLVRKNQTLIEAYSDVTTTDGYHLRVFTIGSTRKAPFQTRSTSYAQAGQSRQIRKKMVQVINREVSKADINQLIVKLSTEVIGRTVERQCQAIYPLQNVLVRKVKVLRAPKAELARLIEQHGGADALKRFELASQAVEAVVERPAEAEAEAETEA